DLAGHPGRRERRRDAEDDVGPGHAETGGERTRGVLREGEGAARHAHRVAVGHVEVDGADALGQPLELVGEPLVEEVPAADEGDGVALLDEVPDEPVVLGRRAAVGAVVELVDVEDVHRGTGRRRAERFTRRPPCTAYVSRDGWASKSGTTR